MRGREPNQLAAILGGRRGALDATAPAVAFVVVWWASGGSLGWGAGGAVVVALAVAGWRLRRRDRPVGVLVGLFGVVIAAWIALRTGQAANFFLIQLLSNAASVLVWLVSIAIRWPLLGVIVGFVLGRRTRWRRDPALLRAYSRASWVWVGQYVVRVAVFAPLWFADAVVALAGARVALSWPLVAACLAISGAVLFRSLPADHPGLRHPQVDVAD